MKLLNHKKLAVRLGRADVGSMSSTFNNIICAQPRMNKNKIGNFRQKNEKR